MKTLIELTVNDEARQAEVEPQATLLEVLRENLHLTGTKEGCGQGDCGTCIVLVDGMPVNSCLMLAADARGRTVTTIEGLQKGGKLHPLQQSFIDEGAVQCGFCSPAKLKSGPESDAEHPPPRAAMRTAAAQATGCESVDLWLWKRIKRIMIRTFTANLPLILKELTEP